LALGCFATISCQILLHSNQTIAWALLAMGLVSLFSMSYLYQRSVQKTDGVRIDQPSSSEDERSSTTLSLQFLNAEARLSNRIEVSAEKFLSMTDDQIGDIVDNFLTHNLLWTVEKEPFPHDPYQPIILVDNLSPSLFVSIAFFSFSFFQNKKFKEGTKAAQFLQELGRLQFPSVCDQSRYMLSGIYSHGLSSVLVLLSRNFLVWRICPPTLLILFFFFY
jgi:hypothetical protein